MGVSSLQLQFPKLFFIVSDFWERDQQSRYFCWSDLHKKAIMIQTHNFNPIFCYCMIVLLSLMQTSRNQITGMCLMTWSHWYMKQWYMIYKLWYCLAKNDRYQRYVCHIWPLCLPIKRCNPGLKYSLTHIYMLEYIAISKSHLTVRNLFSLNHYYKKKLLLWPRLLLMKKCGAIDQSFSVQYWKYCL